MKINEQYHNLNLLENVTYEFLGRDGETHEETESILVEHMMDVYVNERLTMKLVCIPQHLTELVLGRLFTEGIISSAEDVEQIYICEFGKRARVILSKNKSGQSHEENEDYVALTPTCCTGNRVLNDYFITDQPMTPVTPVPWKNSGSLILQTVSPMVPRFTARPGQLTAVFLPVTENCSFSAKISDVIMLWIRPSVMPCAIILT